MIDLRAARRYAKALFELSEKTDSLEVMDDFLGRIQVLFEKHPEISRILENSTIALGEKEDFLAKVLDPETPALLSEFVKVLVRKKRLCELPQIQKNFHQAFECKQGIKEVEVLSAVPISQANETKLIQTLEKKLNAKIRLITTIRPHLLGGMILRFDSAEINASFRARLDELKQQLLS